MTPQKKKHLGWALVLLLCFWLGNRMGAVYTAASGSLSEKLLSALDIERLLTPPLGLRLSPVFLLWGLGAAAVAGVAAMATVQILKKKQQDLEAPEEAILLDLDGDGEVDVKLEDRDGDGKIDTVTTETAPAQAEAPAEPEEPAQKTTEAP